MKKHFPLALILALTLPVLAAPVDVKTEKMTFKVATRPEGPRGQPNPAPDMGNYPTRGGAETITEEIVDVIKLNNGLVEAWVCPAWGMRLLRAFDVKTKTDYFAWKGETNIDYLSWGNGGVKATFPFFEHGMRLRQPGGYRIVNNADGSVTVAMDMRFTQHQKPRDMERYGRYTEESLNVLVTVKPDTSAVYWREIKENPTTLPRSNRLWNCTTLTFPPILKPADSAKPDAKPEQDLAKVKESYKVIFPARFVTNHGPTEVHTSPHWSNLDNWDVSHFAIDAPYGLMGIYEVAKKTNYLRLNDPVNSPGAKLYTGLWGDRIIVELWGSSAYVFEASGPLKPAYEPVEFSNVFYIAQGIGPVTAANDEVAVSVNGNAFELVATRPGAVSVQSGGKDVAAGEAGPNTPLKGNFDGKELTVLREGKQIFRQTFPLDRPAPAKDTPVPAAVQAKFETLKKFEPSRPEMEQIMNNEGMTNARYAIDEAKKITDGSKPAYALSIARTLFRLGQLDEAQRIANLCPGPDADFVKGLVTLERTGKYDFGNAGWEAEYLRGLGAIKAHQTAEALKHIDAYLAKVPDAWKPRLTRACLAKDKAAAQKLAEENPGSPEAQLVLEMLGDATAKAEKEKLVANNPDADKQVALFASELGGEWHYPQRFTPILAK